MYVYVFMTNMQKIFLHKKCPPRTPPTLLYMREGHASASDAGIENCARKSTHQHEEGSQLFFIGEISRFKTNDSWKACVSIPKSLRPWELLEAWSSVTRKEPCHISTRKLVKSAIKIVLFAPQSEPSIWDTCWSMWVQRRGTSGLTPTSCRLLWACFQYLSAPLVEFWIKPVPHSCHGAGRVWEEEMSPLSTAMTAASMLPRRLWQFGMANVAHFGAHLPHLLPTSTSLVLTQQLECDLSSPLGGDGWNSWNKCSSQTLISPSQSLALLHVTTNDHTHNYQ